MLKLVIDTNVIVSALILEGSIPSNIINACIFEHNSHLCLSEEILEEYKRVFTNKKFSRYVKFSDKANLVLAEIEDFAVIYRPKLKLNILSDISDNKFLELAETAKADFLITGNIKDFNLKSYKSTKILTPVEFWKNFL